MDHSNEKNNVTIAKFVGYYQPEPFPEDLHGFEVYASRELCLLNHPQCIPMRYEGEEIEGPTFVDTLNYHKDWNKLHCVIDRIHQITEFGVTVSINRFGSYIEVYDMSTNLKIESFHSPKIDEASSIDCTYEVICVFLNWYNKEKNI